MRFYIFFLILIYTHSNIFCQTVIIAKKTKDAIYVGADSRLVLSKLLRFGQTEKDTTSICKILTFGKLNVALVGYQINIAAATAKRIAPKSTNFTNFIKELQFAFMDSIRISLRTLSIHDLELFNEKIALKEALAGVYVFGKEADSLRLCWVSFFATIYDDQTFDVQSRYYDSDIFATGHIMEISDTLTTSTIWKNGIPNTITYLIQKEAKLHPIEVGGQIHLVRYDLKKGVEWIGGKKPPCN